MLFNGSDKRLARKNISIITAVLFLFVTTSSLCTVEYKNLADSSLLFNLESGKSASSASSGGASDSLTSDFQLPSLFYSQPNENKLFTNKAVLWTVAGILGIGATIGIIAALSKSNSSNSQSQSASPPVVTSISPTMGPLCGGTSVTINGTGFTGATGVRIGGVSATDVTVKSDAEITATTPASLNIGSTSVIVSTPGGSSAANNNNYAYEVGTPISLSITPNNPTLTGSNEKVQLIATGTYGNGRRAILTKYVTWGSLHEDYVKINNLGLATAVHVVPGAAIITASYTGVKTATQLILINSYTVNCSSGGTTGISCDSAQQQDYTTMYLAPGNYSFTSGSYQVPKNSAIVSQDPSNRAILNGNIQTPAGVNTSNIFSDINIKATQGTYALSLNGGDIFYIRNIDIEFRSNSNGYAIGTVGSGSNSSNIELYGNNNIDSGGGGILVNQNNSSLTFNYGYNTFLTNFYPALFIVNNGILNFISKSSEDLSLNITAQDLKTSGPTIKTIDKGSHLQINGVDVGSNSATENMNPLTGIVDFINTQPGPYPYPYINWNGSTNVVYTQS